MRTVWRSFREAVANARKGVGTFSRATDPILKPFYPVFRVVIAVVALQVAINATYPYLFGRLTDQAIKHNEPLAQLLFALLVLQGILYFWIAYRRKHYEREHLDWVMNHQIMTQSLERICGFSLAQSAQMHSGKSRDIVRKGRLAIRYLVYMMLYRLGPTAIQLVVALVCLLCTYVLVGGIALIGTTAYLIFGIYLFQRHREPLKALRTEPQAPGVLVDRSAKHPPSESPD